MSKLKVSDIATKMDKALVMTLLSLKSMSPGIGRIDNIIVCDDVPNGELIDSATNGPRTIEKTYPIMKDSTNRVIFLGDPSIEGVAYMISEEGYSTLKKNKVDGN